MIDTYGEPSFQEESFFRVPYDITDLLWYALEHGVPVVETAQGMGSTEEQVQRALSDLVRKRGTMQYLRTPSSRYGLGRNG